MINNRIRQLRKELELSQKEFAEKIGLKQNAISYMEKPEATVTEQNIKTICAEFGINENWLRKGDGEKYTTSPFEKDFLAIFDNLTIDSQNYLLKMAEELLKTEEKLLNQKKEND